MLTSCYTVLEDISELIGDGRRRLDSECPTFPSSQKKQCEPDKKEECAKDEDCPGAESLCCLDPCGIHVCITSSAQGTLMSVTRFIDGRKEG